MTGPAPVTVGAVQLTMAAAFRALAATFAGGAGTPWYSWAPASGCPSLLG